MTGSDFNLMPPDWVMKLIFLLALVGAVTVMTGAVFAIVWLVKHIQFV